MLFPVDPLTNPGAIQGGSAFTAAKERDIFRCYNLASETALGHDCFSEAKKCQKTS
jgi:hypothetical protein